MKIKNLNISLTGKCNANCVYCPSERAIRTNRCDMDDRTFQTIIKKIPKDIQQVYPCENGELFINPKVIEFIRKLRKTFKKARMDIFTNFSLLNAKRAETLIKEKLIDGITTNQDGFSEEGYFKTKKLPLLPSRQNLLKFIELRDKYKSPIKITISVHTVYRYTRVVKDAFGCLPQKLSKLPQKNEESEIIKFWAPKLTKGKDRMLVPVIHVWAERNNPKIKDKHKTRKKCPLYEQIKNSVFIAANGDVYICCYDANYNIVFGNINSDSLDKILKQKQKFLESEQFPCSFSWSCVRRREKREIL